MGIAITLKEFFENHQTAYELIPHPRTASTLESSEVAHIPGDRMVKGVLLGDQDQYMLALIPATHHLNIGRVNQILGRKLELITEDELASAFSDCEVGAIPPVGEAYGIETLLDSNLADQAELYLESGDHSVLIRMEREAFLDIVGGKEGLAISEHL
ncbi:MAG: YbaK/EbsC family protein [Sedimenticola sp.]